MDATVPPLDFPFLFTHLLLPLLSFYLLLSWLHHCTEHVPHLDHTQRTVLVTGSNGGIGQQIVTLLLAQGDIVLGVDLQPTLPPSQCTTLLHYYPCDITNPTAVQALADQIAQQHTTIDCLVNCAGINRGGPLVEMAPEHMALVLNVNVLGAVHMTRSFFPLLCREKGPKLLYISSEVGWSNVTAAFNAPYSMSKVCLESYVVGLRQEMTMLDAPPHVVVINPGAMQTPLLKDSITYGFTPQPGSLWTQQMHKGGAVAVAYMEKHGQHPSAVAAVIGEIVHDRTPQNRYLINVSWEMTVAKVLPQCVLDYATVQLMSSGRQGSWKMTNRLLGGGCVVICVVVGWWWGGVDPTALVGRVCSICHAMTTAASLAGLVAGMVSSALLYPLENIETRQQTTTTTVGCLFYIVYFTCVLFIILYVLFILHVLFV